jgi:hypothetical protein
MRGTVRVGSEVQDDKWEGEKYGHALRVGQNGSKHLCHHIQPATLDVRYLTLYSKVVTIWTTFFLSLFIKNSNIVLH